MPEAIGHLEQALRIKPDLAEAHNNLGTALYQTGKPEEAIEHYEQAVRIEPEYAEAHYNLGIALGQVGRIEDAIGHYEQAVRIEPEYAEAHYNLGIVLDRGGRMSEAIEHLEKALRIMPDSVPAQSRLAWLLATLPQAEGGDAVRAVGLAQRACTLTGNRVAANLDVLAAAYAAAGRFDDAIGTAEKALELARAGGQPRMAEKIESRLQLYRDGQAYRQAADVTQ
jgi:tetratricopeptide (TPR) repeat protein